MMQACLRISMIKYTFQLLNNVIIYVNMFKNPEFQLLNNIVLE